MPDNPNDKKTTDQGRQLEQGPTQPPRAADQTELQSRQQARQTEPGRFRLLDTHVLPSGVMLPAGTEVGEGTPYPWPERPSNLMAGLDDAGRKRVNDVHQRLYGRDSTFHTDLEEADKAAQEQQKVVDEAKPVSYAQAYEQGKEWDGKAATQHPSEVAPQPVLSRGGTLAPAAPIAVPQQDIADPDVQTRTARPMKDQLPKTE